MQFWKRTSIHTLWFSWEGWNLRAWWIWYVLKVGPKHLLKVRQYKAKLKEGARERSLLFAHSAVTPPQLLTISRRICESIQEKNLLAANSVNSPAQGYLTSRNTCWHIQERSLSGVTKGTIHALGLLCLFWGKQFEDTLKNAHWEKSDKCNQCDFASSVTCYFGTHLKNTQWRKVKQMSGEQMYYNHLRQAFYGDT